MGRPAAETGHLVNVDLRLGQNLLRLYLLGKIALTPTESIWVRFLDKADDEIIGQLILDIGWALSDHAQLSKEFLDRLTMLWEWLTGQIDLATDPTLHKAELRGFGAWFGSGKFDDAWALEQLRKVLILDAQVEAGDQVISRLAEVVDQFPVEALQCAILLVRGATKRWMLNYWRGSLKRLISATRNSEDHHVQQMRNELVSIALSKGVTDLDQSI